MVKLNLIEKVAVVLGALWAALAVLLVRWVLRGTWTTAFYAVVAVELLWLLYGYSIVWIAPRNVPGPAPRLFSGHYDRILNESGAFYRECFAKYASAESGGHGVFRIFVGRRVRVVVCDVDLIAKITSSEFQSYDGRPNPVLRARENFSLLTIRGPLWHRIRTALVPTFSQQNLKAIFPHLVTAADRLVRNLQTFSTAAKLDVLGVWAGMTMEAIGLVGFGTDFHCQTDKPGLVADGAAGAASKGAAAAEVKANGDAAAGKDHVVVSAAKDVFNMFRLANNKAAAILNAFPFLLPIARTFASKEMAKSLAKWERLDDTTMSIVANRRADPNWTQQNDLLTRILEAKDTRHEPLREPEVRDQVNTFLLAGYETTSTALTFATLLLAQNPDKEKVLQAEIDKLCAEHEPDFDNLAEYEYTEAVIKEALRLYPPALVSRAPSSGTVIRTKDTNVTYHIPADTMVHCPPSVVHYDARHYADPFAFAPERWLPDSAENAKRSKYAVLWFGAGPRGCIGSRLAMEEAKLALIAVYRACYFRLHRDTRLPVETTPGITHGPKYPVFMTVHQRAAK